MRRLLPLLLLLLPTSAMAQETYQFSSTAQQQARINRGRLLVNRATCLRLGLPAGFSDAANCTQAQACIQAGAVGGASCTAAQARAENARIYPNTTAGREEAMVFEGVVPWVMGLTTTARATDPDAYCTNFWASANTTTRNAECTKSGLPNDCDICPNTP
jgi:hypothetical protein